ncbi:MAG TPA: hypothetical protein VGR32_01975 [Brevundimonas sp.]|jgi:hypothetical protein|uniref:hypothetical protein n=1 Tax=Brevundimonas sp. TaxID=1871086 RepID=UPI002DE9DBE4|nr:hypothetical protein [Brevundimonas sp.]
MVRIILSAAVLTLAGGAASDARAQIAPWPGASTFDQHRHDADRNLQAMEARRRDADLRQAEAARTGADARAASVRIEAARLPALPYPGARQPAPAAPVRPGGGFPAPASGGDVTRIDAWLRRAD